VNNPLANWHTYNLFVISISGNIAVKSQYINLILFYVDSVDKGVLDALPELEIYNSCFTSKANEWALGFCGDMIGAENPCLSVESISLENVVALDLSDRSIHKLPEVRYLMSAIDSL
jgi:tubulin--tyrosine ligase-like protein 12